MNRKERKKIEKTCDLLWSTIIRSVGECQKCGSKKNLQAAHIVSRRNKLLRWDLRNGICLCVRCHIFWQHKNPVEFAEWLRLNYPEKYEFALNKDKIYGKVDIEETLHNLISNSSVGNILEYQEEIRKNMLKTMELDNNKSN